MKLVFDGHGRLWFGAVPGIRLSFLGVERREGKGVDRAGLGSLTSVEEL